MIATTDELFKVPRGSEAELRLASAYEAVFLLRNATKDDLDMVMVDLAEFTGYFAVAPAGTSEAELRDLNGKRAVFARILSLIKLPMGRLSQLREAALVEMQISSLEGER